MSEQKHCENVDKPLSPTVIYHSAEARQYRKDILFVDTEYHPETKVIESVQMRYNGKYRVFEPPFDKEDLKDMKKLWKNARAVVMHNAPHDLGVLTILPGNDYEWREEINKRKKDFDADEPDKFSYWYMKIFGCEYKVKRLSSVYSFIRANGKRKATPVIDTVKLYDIFIDKDSGLKKLAAKYLGRYMIPWSKENARTEPYRRQDVEALDGLWCYFETVRQGLDDMKDYTYEDLMKIDSVASCAKKATLKAYPDIEKWRHENEEQDKKFGLWNSLESAYLGGLTIAMYHGTVKGVSVNDIKGSYDGVINHENMDQYNRYMWEKIEPPTELPENNYPILCHVMTNVVMKHMENSLKIFKLKGDERKDMVYWSYDILALKILFPDADFHIFEAHRPIPLNDVKESLAGMWNAKKKWVENHPDYGKGHPLRNYYKTLSNASYGICAQKKHGRGMFTNMAKAGIITARARLTLAKMIKVAWDMGCDWLYSDTDSVVVRLNGVNPAELEKAMNEAIYPHECECEFIGDMRVIALKRYWGYNGKDLKGNPIEDKIKVHGKGRYKITKEDLKRMISGDKIVEELFIKQVSATTDRTMKQVKKVNKALYDVEIEKPFPFMFVKNIPTGRPKQAWFDEDWKTHIDAKTTFEEGAGFDKEFERHFPEYSNYDVAVKRIHENAPNDEPLNVFIMNETDWDAECDVMFEEEY